MQSTTRPSKNRITRIRKRKVVSPQRTRGIRRPISRCLVDPDEPLTLSFEAVKIARDTVRRVKAAQTAVHRVYGEIRIVGEVDVKLVQIDVAAFIDRSETLGGHGEGERG